MKIVATGDLHITDHRPKFRTDHDFLAFQIGLLEAVLLKAGEIGAAAVVVPGDFLDSWDASNAVVTSLIKLLQRYPAIKVITTLGQHDVRSQNIAKYTRDSALWIVECAMRGQLTVLTGGTHTVLRQGKESTAVYGFGFRELETQMFLDGRFSPSDNCSYRVAILHASVGDNATPSSVALADQLLYGVDIAVFGDIHQGAALTKFPDGVAAFGCGIMTPMKADEADHKPTFATIDLKNGKIKFVKHVHPDAGLYMDFDYLATTKTFGGEKPVMSDADLQKFRETLAKVGKIAVTDTDLLDMVVKKHKIDKEVVNVIKRYMNG